MITINFTVEEIEQLRHERFNHNHPRVQLKMEALLLKSQGLTHKKIGEILNITQTTLREYFTLYIEGGINKLKEISFYSPQSDLENYKGILEEEFTKNPPATIKEAMSIIKDLTGIERSDVAVGKFLKKNGLKKIESCSSSSKGRC